MRATLILITHEKDDWQKTNLRVAMNILYWVIVFN